MSSSLFDYLERLRSRPESTRRRVLLAAASALTLVIFLLWLLNLKYVGSLSQTAAPVPAAAPQLETSFLTGWDRIRAGWQILLKRVNN